MIVRYLDEIKNKIVHDRTKSWNASTPIENDLSMTQSMIPELSCME